jgi:hypothetical protein
MEKQKEHNRSWPAILVVGMALGTAWAVRGQFGHEQGAAWAGGIGVLVLVLVSQRNDWYVKILPITLSSAFGWGVTGMISYGRVVGYGRSDHFPNAFYGLLMLFVIGALFGLLGGGLTALSLESAKEKKVNWPGLIAEMTAGALIVYGFLVMQLEVLMTPPRSEAWALCLGAGLAMIWHMARKGFLISLRVALYTALGAGFGFAFGNFLQILGNVLDIRFNMWNVMEYSIGFFGGSSLAYSIFTSKWPTETQTPEKWENVASFLLVFVLIPMIVFRESLQYKYFLPRFGEYDMTGNIALISTILSVFFIAVSVLFIWLILKKSNLRIARHEALWVTTIYFGLYILLSYVITGVVAGKIMSNHVLYVANLIIILLLLKRKWQPFSSTVIIHKSAKPFFLYLVAVVAVIMILAFISVNIHEELAGAHNRFGLEG